MRTVITAFVIASLFAGTAAAEMLAPGRPAGVRAAAKSGPSLLLVTTVGAAAVAGAAVLISQGHSALGTTVISGGQPAALPITNSTVTTSSTGTAG